MPATGEDIKRDSGSFSVLFSTDTPGPETPSNSHRSVTGPGLWVALPVLGWSHPCLSPPRPFHTSRGSSHIILLGWQPGPGFQEGESPKYLFCPVKVSPWQAETAAHPMFPNWGWMGQRTTLGKGPCLYREGQRSQIRVTTESV